MEQLSFQRDFPEEPLPLRPFRRADAGFCWAAVQELAGGAEVADVGHAGADEDLVDLAARDLGQQLGVVGVVGAADDGLLNFSHAPSPRKKHLEICGSDPSRCLLLKGELLPDKGEVPEFLDPGF